MSTRKTYADDGSAVDDFLATVSEQRQAESRVLIEIMSEITGEPAVMWGASIIGFGSDDGGASAWPLLAFSPRKAKISLYITGNVESYLPALDAMGKHSVGKGCIYLNKLADVDAEALRALIERTYHDQVPC